MVKKIILLIIVATGLVAVGYFFFHTPSESQRIINRLHRLASSISKQGSEGAVTLALKHQTIAALIDAQCSVFIREAMLTGNFTPEEFAAQMLRSRTIFKSIEGKVDYCEVELSADQTTAIISFAVRISGELKNGRKIDEVRDLQATVKKVDEKWLFSNFEIRQVLEK
jgi:hypothetical protein